MFIDQAEIMVKAGDGGNGCVAFRREKFVPRGGPSGGDGGRGGSVILVAREDVDTLMDFSGRKEWEAQRGHDGGNKEKTGADGSDLIIKVPVGTIVTDLSRNLIIKDLKEPGQTVCVARGGRGGKGNRYFRSATNQTPREAEEGRQGKWRRLKLELKLIADIGLVGLPNAGKSTLLSRISAARPKIAPYPFTTLSPNLGIVELSNYRRYVVADIPGLIEGSHLGQGLGHDFLRHIERTRIILHLVDISGFEGDPLHNYQVIRGELEKYSFKLAGKEEIVVASKMDLDIDQERLREFEQRLGQKVVAISSATGKGLADLVELLWGRVQAVRQLEKSLELEDQKEELHLDDISQQQPQEDDAEEDEEPIEDAEDRDNRENEL